MYQGPQNSRRVLFVITKATRGGAQKYVFDLATALSPQDFSASLAYGERGELAAKLAERGVATHAISAMGRDIALVSDVMSFFQILHLLRQVRPDIVHLNSSKAAALGALAARITGVPRIVTTIHGWPFKEHRSAPMRAFIYGVSWLTCLLSDRVIVVSKRDEEIGRAMLGLKKKIVYIPLAVEAIEFLSREDASAEIEKIRTIENPALPRVVTIAELTGNKGLVYGIDAIAELKLRNIPVRYFVIGAGELREALEEHAIEKQVENDVVFLGFVEHASRLLKAFDVFLLPSIKEGMPYVLLEALEAGLPIVATDVIDPAFQENHERATLVPPRNAALLADALERALEQETGAGAATKRTLKALVEETVALYKTA